MNISAHFNDLEKAVLQYQGHALTFNEFKNNRMKTVPIDTYLGLLDCIINLLISIKDESNKLEMKINDQQEQIDNLLDCMNNLKVKN